MLKERAYIYKRLNLVADAVVTGMSFLSAMFIRGYFETGSFKLPRHYMRYFWIFYLVLLLWPLLLNINDMYPANRLRRIKRTATIIVKSSLQGLFIILALLFIFRLQIVSRLVMAGFAVITTGLLFLKESVAIYYIYLLRKAGVDVRNVLVVGTTESVKDIVKTVDKNSFLGLRVMGLLAPSEEKERHRAWGHKILGDLDDIEKVLHAVPVDVVIIAIERKDYRKVNDIIFHCEEEGIEIWLTASLFNIKIASLDADELIDIPIFVFRTTPKFSWQIFIKSAFDRAAGVILFLLSLPLITAAMVVIKLTSGGPVLFQQIRCGLQGRRFTLYKLRTMYADAEKRKKRLERENIMEGPAFKLNSDPRITSVGRILRKFSIDEMPQFWNALKGDMSIVGPRPPLPDEVKRYKGWQRRRLSMKPGITGLWQISGRSKITDFSDLAKLDLQYIDTWSLWLDVKIFLKTILVVLSTKGAK